MTLSPSPLLKSLIELSIRAGAEIMAIYATDFSAKEKGDLTPVTEADEAAEKIILAGLSKIDGSIPVISEEAASPAAFRRSRPGSSSSTRSTAPRNSSRATASSPSTSPSSRTACPWRASSMPRR